MGLTEIYQQKLRAGDLKTDAGQELVVNQLALLAAKLSATQPPEKSGFFDRFWGRSRRLPTNGLYIHGAVGRGKTMLMDLFYESLSNYPKRRIHFHAFMQDVHHKRATLKSGNVINAIAVDIAQQAKLLCLDEMQINDIADAMIIGRLYDALHRNGVCLVTTANLPPSGLYHEGLNRHLFLPFIAQLETTMKVISLDSPKDYRLGRVKARDTYIFPLGPQTTIRMAKLWADLTDHAEGKPDELAFLGRKLVVPRAAKTCAWFSFAQLCEQSLGAADYLALSSAYKTLFLESIPKLKKADRNAAKRFILLIDTLYDRKTKLVASAAAAPEEIYSAGDHHYEFARTISRLKEMQSATWWDGKIAET